MSIHIEDLTVRFKNSVTAIDHADLDIPNGIFGLLGENGAGKTTLMRVLTTVLKPTNGMVTLDGILYSEGNYEKIQRKIGYLPQEIELYPNLTVQECLEYMGDLAGVPKAECRKRIDYYLKKTSLIEHRKKKMKQLSGGMKRRVGLVQALLNEPEFLIVDEPTTGLDPEERIRIRNLLVDFSENRTVLFSTHVVEDLAATCNQLAIMHKGSFLYAGSMKDLSEEAQGKIWICKVPDENKARDIERKYRITSKQYVEGGLQLMKSDKARKVTSREYIMKLIYQIEMNKEDIENIEERLDIFLNDNLEYIINRYEELRLQYSNNPNIELDNIELDDAVDREYMNIICKNLKENKDKIDELINKYAKNWSVNRMPKVDLSILRLAICELVFIEEIPSKVSINEAIELAKLYCDDKAPKFINGILGSVVNEFETK